MKRRSFLQLAARQLAIGPVGLGVLHACTPPPPEDWRPLALRAATYFPQEDLESARGVGARFLDAGGREEAGVVQQYEDNPRLIAGLKFALRCYMVCVSERAAAACVRQGDVVARLNGVRPVDMQPVSAAASVVVAANTAAGKSIKSGV